ncbi:hypothetical protein LOK49_LG02G03221 [Camellia lanceoleosa]|uniref:Uncharacterized protein n=1 Tax=Camellia lanceoleosa TaxID=1840588 RepID=A0ACC0IHY6_9ERIC|nr:hypothetical protein LOK49_LG02G03221 [Camellia lanceoleosa]
MALISHLYFYYYFFNILTIRYSQFLKVREVLQQHGRKNILDTGTSIEVQLLKVKGNVAWWNNSIKSTLNLGKSRSHNSSTILSGIWKSSRRMMMKRWILSHYSIGQDKFSNDRHPSRTEYLIS